ncbi:MAG: manganese catalase family protein [Phycisphaerales bacterium]|nr:manganese catalase family protein [Phycisphaerales bacterium]
MILRLDRLMTALPMPSAPEPNGAAAVQELMGGKFGEMSTIMNYTMQSFNMRGRSEIRPFYDLVANIAAEEFAHIELVSYTINLMLTGATLRGDEPGATPLADAKDWRNTYHAIATGQQAMCADSHGRPWTGDNVFCSGNLKLDLLHNFFLECGARANKIRVYEMTDHPTARAMVGFLLVRGGVHIVAYAKALEKLSGVPVGKLLPIPDISNKRFAESAKHEATGEHLRLYRFSPDDYKRVGEIWNGTHPEDEQMLQVIDGPPEGAEVPDLEAEPQLCAPQGPDADYTDPDMLLHYAKTIFGRDLADGAKANIREKEQQVKVVKRAAAPERAGAAGASAPSSSRPAARETPAPKRRGR